MQPMVPSWEKKTSKPLAGKTCGGFGGRMNSQLHREFIGETHRVLEHVQIHPPGNQHQKGPIYLWVPGEVTESWLRAQQAALFPLTPSPHTAPQHSNVGCPFLVNT